MQLHAPYAQKASVLNNRSYQLTKENKQYNNQSINLPVQNMKNLYFYVLALITLACTTTASAGTYRVWFDNTEKWARVCCHNWVDGGAGTAWPGVDAEFDATENLYFCDVDDARPMIIFNNGNNGRQTPKIKATPNGVYNPAGDLLRVKEDTPAIDPSMWPSVWFRNTNKWEKVYCYTWKGTGTGWPGQEMTYDETYKLYTCKVNPAHDMIIIHNNQDVKAGGGDMMLQTGVIYDMTGNTGKLYNTPETKTAVSWKLEIGTGSNEFPLKATTTPGYFRAFNVPACETEFRVVGLDSDGMVICTLATTTNIVEQGIYPLTQNETTGQLGLSGAYNFAINVSEMDGVYTCNLEVEKTAFVYFEKPADWATAYAYAWTDKTPMVTWPGVEMTQVDGNLYSAAVEGWCQNILFVDKTNENGHKTKDLKLILGCKYSFSKNNDGSVDINPSADAPANPRPEITLTDNAGDVVGETLRYVKTEGMTEFTVSFKYDQPYTLYYRVIYMEEKDVVIPGYSKAATMAPTETTPWTRVEVDNNNTAAITLKATQGQLHLAALVDNQLTNPTEYWFGEKGVITGVESIDADNTAAPAAYYTLQGARVAQPVSGNLYIRIQNGKATKTLVR